MRTISRILVNWGHVYYANSTLKHYIFEQIGFVNVNICIERWMCLKLYKSRLYKQQAGGSKQMDISIGMYLELFWFTSVLFQRLGHLESIFINC